MHNYIFGLLTLLVFSCSTGPSNKNQHNADLSLLKTTSNSDTCSICQIDSLVIQTTSQTIQGQLVIDYPIAIELFDKTKTMFKYNNKAGYDTLMKLFNMYNSADRNQIYELTDQISYYRSSIKPFLISDSITIIDTIRHLKYIEFAVGSTKQVIDVSKCRQADGVILFKPGKRPVYWTMKGDLKNCKTASKFSKWYFNCH